MKNKVDWRIICVGIFALTCIEITALLNGINGIILNFMVGAISFVIGVVVPNPIK